MVNDLFSSWRDIEVDPRYNPYFKLGETQLNNRSLLVSWLINVGRRLQLHRIIVQRAVEYLDRVWDYVDSTDNMIDLKQKTFALCCLFVSATLQHDSFAWPTDFIQYLGYEITVDYFNTIKTIVLMVLLSNN